MHPVAIVAAKEWGDCLRSRWLLAGVLLFTILSVAVFFGTAAIGGTLKYQPIATVMNAVLSLSVFLVPLLALLLAYDAFVGEKESGTFLLMATYPLRRVDWLLGKVIGQGAALGLVLVVGFLPFALLQVVLDVPYAWYEAWKLLAVLVVSAWLLGNLFLLLAYWVSLSVSNKAQALAILLLVWFVSVLLYDLGLLVVAVAGADVLGQTTLTSLLMMNPASAFRAFNQMIIGTSAQLSVPLWSMVAVLFAWAVLLFLICVWRLNRVRF